MPQESAVVLDFVHLLKYFNGIHPQTQTTHAKTWIKMYCGVKSLEFSVQSPKSWKERNSGLITAKQSVTIGFSSLNIVVKLPCWAIKQTPVGIVAVEHISTSIIYWKINSYPCLICSSKWQHSGFFLIPQPAQSV